MLHNFNNINFTSLKIRGRGGILKNVAFRIEKKSGNTPDHEPENHEKENIYKVVKLKKI